jgi:hypothetical protein
VAYDAQIVPEGDVELEQWIWAESKIPASPTRPAIYWLWTSPVIGMSNHLELALPFQIVASPTSTSLESIFAEIRYRLFPRERDSGFQPLLRVAYRQAVQARVAPSRIELNLVTAYGRPSELHFTLDLGASIATPWPENSSSRPLILTYGAGVSYPLVGNELQIALEADGQFGVHDAYTGFPRHSVGGALAYSRGRIWITAGCLFGLTGLAPATPRYFPRLLWAVAF